MSYVTAKRNPLRNLPIRQYQGPFKNRLPGLGDIFGPPMAVTGDLPLTGPYTNPTPLTGAALGIAAASANPNLPTGGMSQNLTDWLNNNSGTVAWVAGIGLVVLFLGRMGR